MTPQTAMVLAAGKGTRMRPLTNDRPKALVTVNGKALIDHVLDRLVEAGVRRAVVNVHAFADMLEDHLAKRRDIEIAISDERALLMETGGGVVQALPLLGADPIIVCNIDSVWTEPTGSAIARLAAGYDRATMGARLMLSRVTPPVQEILERSGVAEVIGRESIYPSILDAVLDHASRDPEGGGATRQLVADGLERAAETVTALAERSTEPDRERLSALATAIRAEGERARP